MVIAWPQKAVADSKQKNLIQLWCPLQAAGLGLVISNYRLLGYHCIKDHFTLSLMLMLSIYCNDLSLCLKFLLPQHHLWKLHVLVYQLLLWLLWLLPLQGVTLSSWSVGWTLTITTGSNRHHLGCCCLCCCAEATTSVSNGSTEQTSCCTQACYANVAMDSSLVCFSFRVEPPSTILILVLCCLLSLLGSDFITIYTKGRLNYLGFHHCKPLEHTNSRHICLFMLLLGPCQLHQLTALPILWVGSA